LGRYRSPCGNRLAQCPVRTAEAPSGISLVLGPGQLAEGPVTVTMAVQITQICLIADLSQIDCSAVQIGGSARVIPDRRRHLQ